MRDISMAALDYFATRKPVMPADLFTLTFRDGTTYRFASTDIPITIGADTWLARTPNMNRTSIKFTNTIEVPEMIVQLSAKDDDFIGGTNIKQLIHEGALDGARLKLERLPMPLQDPGVFPPSGGDISLGPPTVMFDGRVGQVQVTAIGATISAKGDVVIMNQYAPHNVYQTSCQWGFCSLGCTLVAASFTTSFTVGAAPTLSFLPWSGAPGTPANFIRGKVTMTSGANIGQVRTIRDASGSGVTVTYPFFQVPMAGDSFDALLGCDKTENSSSGQDCTAYANTQHFRGFTLIPQAVYAL